MDDIQVMLHFIDNERKDDDEKIQIYNQMIYNAYKLGIDALNSIKNKLVSYNLTDNERKLLQKNIDFYISKLNQFDDSECKSKEKHY